MTQSRSTIDDLRKALATANASMDTPHDEVEWQTGRAAELGFTESAYVI